jgi:hypothetical protein
MLAFATFVVAGRQMAGIHSGAAIGSRSVWNGVGL